MSSSQFSNAVPVAQLTYAAASFTSSYTAIGSFSAPLVWGMIMSTLDQAVQLSFDGLVDHIAVPAGSTTPVFIPISFKDNHCILSKVSVFGKEIGNPTTGSLYFCGFSATIP